MGSEFDDIDCSGGADVAPLVGEDEETVENSVGALDAENRAGGDDGMVENSIARDSVAFEGGAILEPVEGMEFESEEAAKVFYNSYARHVGFSIRASTIHRSMRDGNIISRNFVCSKEGFRQEKHLNNENRIKRPRAITREGCKAMLMVKKIGIGKWVVKKFVRDHNHAMVSPAQVQYLRSHRSSSTVQHPVTVGVRPSFIMPVSSEESGGICNVDVSERDCKSYIGPDRQKTLGRGDSQAVLDYFKSMQAENPAFFYAVQVDEEDRMTDFFWVDARSRMAYHYFGDVVTFDTTYMMSQCRMPFAPFVGVNHHQQPVSFGCALLLDETESSFVWLFNTWLEAMSGRHPISIITDQDQPIEAAVARVFPGARHRFCLRNILRKAAEKLSDVYHTHEKFKDEFYQCIQTMETIDEFESCWGLLHARYDIRDNEWVQSLYNIRHQWVPSYLRNTFFAEIPTTQQSESIKPFFDGNVNSNMTLVEFVKQYARTLDGRYEKEIHADFETIHTQPILKTQLPMEKQAAHIYTRTIFIRFQEELFESLCYIAEKIEDNRVISTYRVAKFGDEKRAYTVKLNVSETSASCSCQMFEFSGILCKHVLIVFRMTNILMLPPYYILKRWTRNAKSGMVLGERGIGIQGDCSESLTLRYNDLCHQAIKFAEDGAASADIYRVALCALQKAFEEVVAAKRPVVRVDQLSTPISRNIRQENISESEADSSSNQKKIKQYNINIANDNYTRGNSGIGGFTSTGPNDLHSPGSASAEGFGLSTRNLSMMNSQCKGKDCLGWAARDASGLLSPYTFKLRIPGNDDISLKITHCGVCHADITSIKNKLGNSKYPLVPGHEIVGTVTDIGCNVSRFKIGDHVGVGTYVNSCRECEWCNDRLEVHCVKGPISTFNGIDGDGTITKGGFSSHIVVHERYCYKIPENYPLALAAPLMCAGITVYAPMVRHKMNQPSKSLGVIGLGGLGHLAVKFGKAFGLHVTVFSTSISKNVEAEILGADKFVLSSDKEQMAAMKKSLDFIIDIASGGRSFDIYLPVLKTAGVLVLLGFPSEIRFNPSTLNLEMRTISGSLSGGTKDTQEMLDFCAAHDIYPEIEVIKIQDINDALDRLLSREVKHRFMVIDMEKSAKVLRLPAAAGSRRAVHACICIFSTRNGVQALPSQKFPHPAGYKETSNAESLLHGVML